jgi:hypothetical protein
MDANTHASHVERRSQNAAMISKSNCCEKATP